MPTWGVSVFDEATDKLVEQFKVYGIDRADVCALWELDRGVPPSGEFLVTERELGRLNQLLDRQLRLEPGRVIFIRLHRDYPGEVIEEPGRRALVSLSLNETAPAGNPPGPFLTPQPVTA